MIKYLTLIFVALLNNFSLRFTIIESDHPLQRQILGHWSGYFNNCNHL